MKILLAVDGSPCSDAAVEEIAKEFLSSAIKSVHVKHSGAAELVQDISGIALTQPQVSS